MKHPQIVTADDCAFCKHSKVVETRGYPPMYICTKGRSIFPIFMCSDYKESSAVKQIKWINKEEYENMMEDV